MAEQLRWREINRWIDFVMPKEREKRGPLLEKQNLLSLQSALIRAGGGKSGIRIKCGG